MATLAPIVLFLPARNEATTVAAVVQRAPAFVGRHPVLVVVVDDGSDDGTAAAARVAGATVVSTSPRGLGAAVRTGLQAAVDMRAIAVAFCDADGEYAPEELEILVAPILANRADYVVGSRFDGTIRRMLPHRRFGNRVLTAGVRMLAHAPVTDGQSGYRALSLRAATDAEIVHDYNYAQVLTLDVLRKGYRYDEVPITYSFREHGKSFVRLIPYLRRVVPAVWRVLRTPPRSVFDDMRREDSARVGPALTIDGTIGANGVGRSPGHGQRVMRVVVGEESLPPKVQTVG